MFKAETFTNGATSPEDGALSSFAAAEPNRTEVNLCGLATAVPEFTISQEQAKQSAREIFGIRTSLFRELEAVFDNAAISNRHICQPLEWFFGPSGFEEKSKLYEEHALALAQQVAEKALDAAGLQPHDIDAIVTVSSTGVTTPSLDARLMNIMPFRSGTLRLPVFGLGCAGGVLGLTRAAQIAQSRPGSKCLLITLELCSLAFRYDRLTKSNIVATALFGDGAAAAVVSTEGGSADLGALGAGGEHCWPDTLNVMGWKIDSLGLDVIFHRSIPQIVADDYGAALSGFMDGADLTMSEIARPCCHPGGAKVIAALESVFDMETGTLDAEWDVLRRFGNMSAPTVLFVLEELVRRGHKGQTLLSALGPGFTAAFQTLDLAGADAV